MHMHIKYLDLLAMTCYILKASVMNNVRTWIDRRMDGWRSIDGR